MRPSSKVNSRDVARLAGVSQSTVSKVANNSASLTASTRAKVVKAAHQLGYALTPRSSSYQVALIFPGTEIKGYVGSMLSGLVKELLDRGIKLEIVSGDHLEILNERCVNCAVAINWDEDFYKRYQETLSLPLVRINGVTCNYDNAYSVYPDGIISMWMLVDKLWSLGHRKIGFFFFNTLEHEINNIAMRQAGFLKAMHSRNVKNPEKYCTYNCMRQDSEKLAKILKNYYNDGVTALIFANEQGTGKMMHIINLSGLKIPEDISLIGWESEDLSEYVSPPLSTLTPDPKQIAKAAVDLLEKILKQQKNIKNISFPYRFIERQSIGPARIMPDDAMEQ